MSNPSKDTQQGEVRVLSCSRDDLALGSDWTNPSMGDFRLSRADLDQVRTGAAVLLYHNEGYETLRFQFDASKGLVVRTIEF